MKDLRLYLDRLENIAPEEIIRIRKEYDPRFEIPAVVAKLEKEGKKPVILFEKVKGSDFPIICNLLSSRRKILLALDALGMNLNEILRRREKNSLAPKIVEDGPIKEVVITGKKVDLTSLPIVTHYEKDWGPSITAGITIAKDPKNGSFNAGCYRLGLKGKNELIIDFSTESRHAYRIFRKAEEKNENLPVAIVIGHHPAFDLGALSIVPFGTDELDLVGGIMGEPLPLIKCETIDLEAPAYAEIVLEGEILAGVREKMGPFGDYLGVYSCERVSPVIKVKAITMRENAIYHDVLPGYSEHLVWCGTLISSYIYKVVRSVCPTVQDVYMPISGFCENNCIISIKKISEDETDRIIHAALGAPLVKNSIRYCVVVDDDVNIYDDGEIIKAIMRIPHPKVIALPHSGDEGASTLEGKPLFKIGIDATKPSVGYPEVAKIPGIERIRIGER